MVSKVGESLQLNSTLSITASTLSTAAFIGMCTRFRRFSIGVLGRMWALVHSTDFFLSTGRSIDQKKAHLEPHRRRAFAPVLVKRDDLSSQCRANSMGGGC